MLVIVAIFDSKVNAFLPPLFMRTEGEAVRAFSAALEDTNHEFYKFAEDYTLFELGSFDDKTGKFDSLSTPRSIVTAYTLKSAKVAGKN